MRAEIIVKFNVKNITDEDSLKESGMSFEELVRWLIKEEGLFGICEDKYKILSISEIKRSKRRKK